MVGLIIVAAIQLWRIRKSSSENELGEFETARTEDMAGGVEIEDDTEVIYIPVEPADELEKDAAAIEALKDRERVDAAEAEAESEDVEEDLPEELDIAET